MQYIHRDMTEEFLTLSNYPENMCKKVTLLKYFRDYMSEHLLKVRYIITLAHSDVWYYRLVAVLLRERLMMV